MQSRIEQLCIDRGLKMTEQRRVIARVLSDSSDHPDVEQLYRRATAIDPRISIATVYRTVRLFEEADILETPRFRRRPRALRRSAGRASRPSDRRADRQGDRVHRRGDRGAAARDRARSSATSWSTTGSSSMPCRSSGEGGGGRPSAAPRAEQITTGRRRCDVRRAGDRLAESAAEIDAAQACATASSTRRWRRSRRRRWRRASATSTSFDACCDHLLVIDHKRGRRRRRRGRHLSPDPPRVAQAARPLLLGGRIRHRTALAAIPARFSSSAAPASIRPTARARPCSCCGAASPPTCCHYDIGADVRLRQPARHRSRGAGVPLSYLHHHHLAPPELRAARRAAAATSAWTCMPPDADRHARARSTRCRR